MYVFHNNNISNANTVHRSTLLDFDECSASPPVCDVNSNCQNNVGSYTCSCKTGYNGDGKTCTGKMVGYNTEIAKEKSALLSLTFTIRNATIPSTFHPPFPSRFCFSDVKTGETDGSQALE